MAVFGAIRFGCRAAARNFSPAEPAPCLCRRMVRRASQPGAAPAGRGTCGERGNEEKKRQLPGWGGEKGGRNPAAAEDDHFCTKRQCRSGTAGGLWGRLSADDEVEGVSKIRRMPSRWTHSEEWNKPPGRPGDKEPLLGDEKEQEGSRIPMEGRGGAVPLFLLRLFARFSEKEHQFYVWNCWIFGQPKCL